MSFSVDGIGSLIEHASCACDGHLRLVALVHSPIDLVAITTYGETRVVFQMRVDTLYTTTKGHSRYSALQSFMPRGIRDTDTDLNSVLLE